MIYPWPVCSWCEIWAAWLLGNWVWMLHTRDTNIILHIKHVSQNLLLFEKIWLFDVLAAKSYSKKLLTRCTANLLFLWVQSISRFPKTGMIPSHQNTRQQDRHTCGWLRNMWYAEQWVKKACQILMQDGKGCWAGIAGSPRIVTTSEDWEKIGALMVIKSPDDHRRVSQLRSRAMKGPLTLQVKKKNTARQGVEGANGICAKCKKAVWMQRLSKVRRTYRLHVKCNIHELICCAPQAPESAHSAKDAVLENWKKTLSLLAATVQ